MDPLEILTEEEKEDLIKQIQDIKDDEIIEIYNETVKGFIPDTIITGKVIRTSGDYVLVDIGYKTEGFVQKSEFTSLSDIKPGSSVDVYIETVEDEAGFVVLSKQKADRIRGWEKITKCYQEGDSIRGRVIKKSRGGLIVDAGIPVFLPASQIDVVKIEDIGEYVGREVEVKILKIDQEKMNVIVSRKLFLDEEKEKIRKVKLKELKEGDDVAGVIKSIHDFGAFISIDGFDVLLHTYDISWGKVAHPSQFLIPGQTIKVRVLKVDEEEEKVTVGLKQLSSNPWLEIEKKYAKGAKFNGKVTAVVPYGVFAELEPGIQGLVHISEIKWGRPPSHPATLFKPGDSIDVVVINTNPEKHEITLSHRLATENPWDKIEERYKDGDKIKGKVVRFSATGAFIEIDHDILGFINTKDISWTKKISKPTDILNIGDEVETVVIQVNKERRRILLGMKQLDDNPWDKKIPEKYHEASVHAGQVIRVVSYGVYLQFEDGLESLIHSTNLPKNTSLAIDDKVEVKVSKLELEEQRIHLEYLRTIQK
ncbi:MAG: S1 RNA-binding domain-containing protein [Planctomycetes bacterium]|nr:S1 RNA-binding domain-containing protein [Planctomycetota bacterium]